MRLHSLLYVSESALHPDQAEGEVCSIVDAAVIANQRMDITGALIFTGQHFAQIIEGDFPQIESLIKVISLDRRHRKPRILERLDIGERRFSSWAMAYSGPSQFVSRHVGPLLDDLDGTRQSRTTEWLKDTMAEFAAEPFFAQGSRLFCLFLAQQPRHRLDESRCPHRARRPTAASQRCGCSFGALGDGPPCIRQRPLGIAGDWHGFPHRVRAPQRLA